MVDLVIYCLRYSLHSMFNQHTFSEFLQIFPE